MKKKDEPQISAAVASSAQSNGWNAPECDPSVVVSRRARAFALTRSCELEAAALRGAELTGARGHTAVDRERDTGDERRGVGQEELDRGGDFLWPSPPLHRDVAAHLLEHAGGVLFHGRGHAG